MGNLTGFLQSVGFSPGYRLSWWSIAIDLETQRLCRPAYCINSGARYHHRVPLFSRQVHHWSSHITLCMV